MQRQDEYEKAKSSMFRAEEEHLSSSGGLVKNLNKQLEKKRRLEEEALQKVIIFSVICKLNQQPSAKAGSQTGTWIRTTWEACCRRPLGATLPGPDSVALGLDPDSLLLTSARVLLLLLLLLLGVHTLRATMPGDFCLSFEFGGLFVNEVSWRRQQFNFSPDCSESWPFRQLYMCVFFPVPHSKPGLRLCVVSTV